MKNYNVNINRTTAKKSKLSSGKKDKYEYMTGVEILLLQQQGIIQKAKCSHSSRRKAFEKQRKTIEDQGKNKLRLYKL